MTTSLTECTATRCTCQGENPRVLPWFSHVRACPVYRDGKAKQDRLYKEAGERRAAAAAAFIADCELVAAELGWTVEGTETPEPAGVYLLRDGERVAWIHRNLRDGRVEIVSTYPTPKSGEYLRGPRVTAGLAAGRWRDHGASTIRRRYLPDYEKALEEMRERVRSHDEHADRQVAVIAELITAGATSAGGGQSGVYMDGLGFVRVDFGGHIYLERLAPKTVDQAVAIAAILNQKTS